MSAGGGTGGSGPVGGGPGGAGQGGAGPIRLLVVTHSLSWGGAERFASTLVGGLDRTRFAAEVCVVSRRETTYDLPEGIPVHRLGYGGPADLPRTLSLLRRLVAGGGYAVALSNVLKTSALTGLALAGLRRPPAWVARVGLAPGRGDPLLARSAARALYPRAAVLVANSERMADRLARRHPRRAGRVRHLPNPTDFARLERLAAAEPGPALAAELERLGSGAAAGETGPALLAAVGRLDRQKRPDLALEALARLRERRDARLIWCGEGPLRAGVERQAAALGLAEVARFPGFVDNPFPLLRRAALFVLTSDFEGLPNALIEAQGLGLPAIATRCPYGPDEVIADEATGLLVPPDDAVTLAAAALELLDDPERLRTMGEAAAHRARERYAVERVIPGWQGLLEEIASTR